MSIVPGKTESASLLALWIMAASAFAVEPQRDYLVFGFLPIVSPERLVSRFAPLVNYLSAELGMEIRMETAPDYTQFVQRTQDERRYDILFTAPHLYYLANQNAGYHALAKIDAASLEAVIVALNKSNIRSINDLKGKQLATAGPLALSTLLTRQLLVKNGLDPDRDISLIDTPSQNASLLSTLQGTTDASSLILPVYLRARARVKQNTVIIAQTGKAPHIPIAGAPWLDAAVSARIQTTLITMPASKAGRSILNSLEWPGFVAADEQTYQSLESIVEEIKKP